MHMWMWFGYDLGEFMFAGLVINSRWAFALTWIVLFFVAMLFEASKLYLARVQRDAHKKLFPYRSDERRNLLCEREQGNMATTSRNASSGHVSRWASLRIRMLVNSHQSLVFVLHNMVGYLLMLAVMVYNVHLLLAVVFGMMLGYFLFGPKLTRLQMQCFSTKRVIICTPECDDTAETTPPLLDSPNNSESDLFICRTRTCIQPSHYFPATSAGGDTVNATCYYGAKQCPSRVARAKQMQAKHCHHQKEEPPSVEDAQLLTKQGCCKSKASDDVVSSQVDVDVAVDVHAPSRSHCCKEEEQQEVLREDSPQITCCHNSKSSSTDSQEQIIKPS